MKVETIKHLMEMKKKKATEAIIQRSGDTKVGNPVAEAKATYCGRCGTTHVPPSQGGTCPALKKEETEQIDELTKDTLQRYADKATADHGHQNMARRNTTGDAQKEFARREKNRQKGISRAYDRLYPQNEETELEEGHQVVAKTKEGETMKSAVYPTKKQAMDMHYKMAKNNKYTKVDTVKVDDKKGTNMSMEQYLAAIDGKTNFSDVVYEKTLTAAEKKKREEIAQAMERENPGMDMSKKMAIATAQAKKVAEETEELNEKAHTVPKTAKEKDLAKLAPPHDKITHADVMVGRGVKKEEAGASKKAEDKFHTQLDKLMHKTFGHSPDEKKMKKEEVEQIDEVSGTGTHYTLGNKIDKDHVYRVHISKDKGKTWDSHPDDVYHSLGDAKVVANNMTRTSYGQKKSKITRHPRPKMSGPVGKLPESFEYEEVELSESHFSLGDKVECIKSGMTGTVTKLDKPHGEGDDKYYTVKRNDGKEMKYAPNELRLVKEDLDEAMISYSDFMDKIAMHRKAGNKVVDHKYSSGKAHYTTVDNEGHGRKVTHTPSGQKVEKLGKMSGEDDEAAEVKPTEKRGRGRPAGSKSGGKYK
jgi:hypothetical protein